VKLDSLGGFTARSNGHLWGGKKSLLATVKNRLNGSSAQHSFEKKMFFIEYPRAEMQEGDRSYMLSRCITSVMPSWGTGVPLSRLVFGEKKARNNN